MEFFEIIYGADLARGVPCVSWKLCDGANVPFGIYDLADRLRVRGWQVPAYSMPPERDDLVVQLVPRIFVHNGVTRDQVAALLDDFRRAMEYFELHPAITPLTAKEGTGYHL